MTAQLLSHLARQLESARALLANVLGQNEAIRRQDVTTLLVRLGDLQGEMANRRRLELERDLLIRDAAIELGMSEDEVDLDRILELLPDEESQRARLDSAELRGLLTEISRVHQQNRVLIRQELAFVDHLMRVLGGVPQGPYSPLGFEHTRQPGNVVDARA